MSHGGRDSDTARRALYPIPLSRWEASPARPSRLTAPRGSSTRLARVFRRSAHLVIGLFSAAMAPSLARAQHPPLEATRPGPHPPRVASGDVMVYARAFSAARDGARVLVVYIENQGASAPLRSALFNLDAPADGAPTLARAREDVTLAPEARSATLAWDGRRGAVAYVVPRSLAPALPPGQRRVRAAAVGVPPSTDDPLGPPASSGGSVALLTLDADGNAASPARAVFNENARLWRATLVREPDAWVVAWTGATVTDDEVRGTVRARCACATTDRPRARWPPRRASQAIPATGCDCFASRTRRCSRSRAHAASRGQEKPRRRRRSTTTRRARSTLPPAAPSRRGPCTGRRGRPSSADRPRCTSRSSARTTPSDRCSRGPGCAPTRRRSRRTRCTRPSFASPSAQVFARVAVRPGGLGALVDGALGGALRARGAPPPVSPASVANLTRPSPDAELPRARAPDRAARGLARGAARGGPLDAARARGDVGRPRPHRRHGRSPRPRDDALGRRGRVAPRHDAVALSRGRGARRRRALRRSRSLARACGAARCAGSRCQRRAPRRP